VLTPSNNFYDGRGANRPWLQELPDMTSKTVWGSWAEIHPETAHKLGVKQGEPLRVETSAGNVEVPAYLYAGIRKDTVAIALGQGHTSYGRYAKGRGVNAVRLLPKSMDEAAGAVAYQGANAKLSRGTSAMELYVQQAEKDQHDGTSRRSCRSQHCSVVPRTGTARRRTRAGAKPEPVVKAKRLLRPRTIPPARASTSRTRA
jgi:molybdopterin-containing oxidoreductase family iron-sulfur binding subunit